MSERNKPTKKLESWKQIAAYLDRSERTVRRWESNEGLPVHRLGHPKQDTVFAYKHEIESWHRQRTQSPGKPLLAETTASPAVISPSLPNAYLTEHDAVTRVMHRSIEGARRRRGDDAPSFHSDATISGYCQGVENSGSIDHVFEWIAANGPATNIEARFARIEIIETIAVVHLEVLHWSGRVAGKDSRASDVFTLLKHDGKWKITHKLFHWHDSVI